MRKRIYLPRLVQEDVRELRRMCELLTSVSGSLRASKWAGAIATDAIVRDVFARTAGLYNKAEPAFCELTGEQPLGGSATGAPAPAPAENTTDDLVELIEE